MLENSGKDTVAVRLRYFAHLKFGSIKELASAMGVSPSTLSQYTTGKCVPGNLMQKRLRALGCDVEWLIMGSSTSHDLKTVKSELAFLMSEYRALDQRLADIEGAIDGFMGNSKIVREG